MLEDAHNPKNKCTRGKTAGFSHMLINREWSSTYAFMISTAVVAVAVVVVPIFLLLLMYSKHTLARIMEICLHFGSLYTLQSPYHNRYFIWVFVYVLSVQFIFFLRLSFVRFFALLFLKQHFQLDVVFYSSCVILRIFTSICSHRQS